MRCVCKGRVCERLCASWAVFIVLFLCYAQELAKEAATKAEVVKAAEELEAREKVKKQVSQARRRS